MPTYAKTDLLLISPFMQLFSFVCINKYFNVFVVCHFIPGIKYDAEKEEKQLQEARQRELDRIEETKLKAAEIGQSSALVPKQKVHVCFCPTVVILL